MNIIAMMLSDYYKQCHPNFYPEGLQYLFTCGTARMSRIPGVESIVNFGIQGFVKEYLVERFNKDFFDLDKEYVISKLREFLGETFDISEEDIKRFGELHDLGYLPIRVWAMPEGCVIPIYSQKKNPDVVQVPFVAFESTHEKFAWVAEFLESISSVQLWYPIVIATMTKFTYRNIVDRHWDKSVDGSTEMSAISEFGFRGGQGLEGAVMASSAFLTSFNKTATAPAVEYMKKYYGKDMRYAEIGRGMRSTEHSVMCSNYAVDGNEDEFIVRLLDKIAEEGNISIVCDSYDYWGRIECIIDKGSEIHNKIVGRNGTTYIRGDSGDPFSIVTGTKSFVTILEDKLFDSYSDIMDALDKAKSDINIQFIEYNEEENKYYPVRYAVCKYPCGKIIEFDPSLEELGTVGSLFRGFGGMYNSKGYIELDSKIRAIYGDSITPALAERIYTKLEDCGYAANNVALGAGSFSMQALEVVENGKTAYKPYTRDTFGIAFKATNCIVNGKEYPIYKNPKTDTGFKKSQRGMVVVGYDEEGNIVARDKLTVKEFYTEVEKGNNLMRPIFEDGKVLIDDSLEEIRERIKEY